MKIKKIKVCLEDQVVMTPIEIEGDRIASFSDNDGFDLSNCYLIPGLIDQHIHGSASFDVMDGNVQGLEEMSKSLLKEGTTSFLGTTMTDTLDSINKAIESIYRYKNVQTQGARILGINLEGPFLSKEKCGAQRADALISPSVEFINSLNHLDLIKMVTIAPELRGALEVVKYLTARKTIASIGHTNATYEEVVRGIESGAHQITHGFNAMSEFNHHGVNAVGAILLEDGLKVELICDGIHVSKEAIKLLYKLKGRENIILITDSMRAKYCPSGISELGGQKVIVKGNEARLESGVLAGSVLKLIDAVKNIMNFTSCSLPDAVYMASVNPTKNLEIYDRVGSIGLGKQADLVILNDNLEVLATIIKGKVEYQKEGFIWK